MTPDKTWLDPELVRGMTWPLRWASGWEMTHRKIKWIQRLERWTAPRLPDKVRLEMIDGPQGQQSLAVYVIDCRTEDDPSGAVLHFHGGGHLIGTPHQCFARLMDLSRRLGCLVVSVDYRLAPQAKFPSSLEDNMAALKWLHRQAPALRVDASRIAVLGESAGGGNAAILALAAREQGDCPIACQALIYPMLDDRTGVTTQPEAHVGQFLWTAAFNRFAWSAFLGQTAGGRNVPKGAVPARVENLEGLPPTWIGVGSLDLFHDENVAYAQRLRAAGVPVELKVVRGAYHGFFSLVPDAPVSRDFCESLYAVLSQHVCE